MNARPKRSGNDRRDQLTPEERRQRGKKLRDERNAERKERGLGPLETLLKPLLDKKS